MCGLTTMDNTHTHYLSADLFSATLTLSLQSVSKPTHLFTVPLTLSTHSLTHCLSLSLSLALSLSHAHTLSRCAKLLVADLDTNPGVARQINSTSTCITTRIQYVTEHSDRCTLHNTDLRHSCSRSLLLYTTLDGRQQRSRLRNSARPYAGPRALRSQIIKNGYYLWSAFQSVPRRGKLVISMRMRMEQPCTHA